MLIEKSNKIINKIIQNDYFTLVFRIILGATFIFASLSKISAPQEFVLTVREYQILFEPLATWYGYLLPWLELIFGVMLVVGLFTRFSVGIINVALLSFMIAILINIYRGASLDCGCFGSEDPLGWNTYFRDLVLFLMGIIIFLSTSHKFSIDHWIRRN